MKVLLAQIDYKAAFVHNNVDHLAEPGKPTEKTTPFSKLLDDDQCSSEAEQILVFNRMRYIDYYKGKIESILEFIKGTDYDALVFPEYAIPLNFLPILKDFSEQEEILIIAGTHYVNAINDSTLYTSVGITNWMKFIGQAICPIFTPDGKTYVQPKITRSKFEPNLKTDPDNQISVIKTHIKSGDELVFSVLICSDSLDIENVANAVKDFKPGNTNALFLTALSPSVTAFNALATYLATSEVYVFLCNRADYGHTGVYLPAALQNKFAGIQSPYDDKGERLTEIVMSLPNLFVKKGVVDNVPPGEHFCHHQLAYNTKPDLQQGLRDLFRVDESLSNDESIEAIEDFLCTYEKDLPRAFYSQIEKMIGHLSSGLAAAPVLLKKNMPLFLNINDTGVYLAAEVYEAIRQVIAWLNDTASSALYDVHKGLIEQKKHLPNPKLSTQLVRRTVQNTTPSITEDMLAAFRGRGADIDRLQNAMDDESCRLILLSGSYGIGKTSFVKIALKRHYPNWNVVYLSATEGSRFVNVLEMMASAIAMPLDADTLMRVSRKRIEPILMKLVDELYSTPRRIIVVDDFDHVLVNADGRDKHIIEYFLNCLGECTNLKGKLLFVSNIWFDGNFRESQRTKSILLKELRPKNIKQIIQYQLRRADFTNAETLTDIPEDWLNVINNHPLSAMLLSEMIIEKKEISFEDKPQQYIIQQLLGAITFTLEEEKALKFLSVFRIAIDITLLKKIFPTEYDELLKSALPKLLKRSFITYDGTYLQITEVVRRKFLEDLQLNSDLFDQYNHLATLYYDQIRCEGDEAGTFDPGVFSELSYHLCISGEYAKLQSLLTGNKESLKNNAKILYKRYQLYSKAYEIYKCLNDSFSADTEVLAYLGRCSARLGNWEDVDGYFQQAIDTAQCDHQATSYLYRDWGHILARYGRYDEAKEKLTKAAELYVSENTPCSKDPAILSAQAYIAWQESENERARDLFEEALVANYRHEFTIYNYAKFLKSLGEFKYAKDLESRIIHDDIIHQLPEFEFLNVNDELGDLDDE